MQYISGLFFRIDWLHVSHSLALNTAQAAQSVCNTHLGTPIINTFSVDEQQVNWSKLSSALSFDPTFHSIGVRAENFKEAANESQGFISGQIRHIERVGKDTSIKIKCGEKEVIATNLSGNYMEGDILHLTADVQDILHFDKQGNTMVLEEAVIG